MKKRMRVKYSGTVQGVGFRFTAERVAVSLNLTGWAMNAPDGSVEVLAEGEEKDLVSFIDKIKRAMNHYIRSTRVNWQEYKGEFGSFGIRFY